MMVEFGKGLLDLGRIKHVEVDENKKWPE